MTNDTTAFTLLGTGEMGLALALALLTAGHSTTVWNRTAHRAEALRADGAQVAGDPGAAITASPVVITCLYDHASVHQVLDPVVDRLRGRTVINVTTTTPDESRELAAWAAERGITYLDGGIMAVPEMIGGPGSLILYSGAAEAFEQLEQVLSLWGRSRYLGADAGLAPLYDLAILTPMYTAFAGFLHGAAMVASAGVPATELAELAGPFLTAVVEPSVRHSAEVVDGGDFAVPGQQSLSFSDLTKFITASEAAGVDPVLINGVQLLIKRQIDAGFGDHGFARIFESLRRS
ncbi:NAD(P)-dependent oxidoreductase [Microlunatus parietis]|uniref:3-hydroxyisobutyrate dehydrogenase-like beta-hydroxyacid dehydrogenase n=1 Tax=Microlunatus parietis TaxID=682979 RepID=A0A7Y9LDV9_9ACTN|nr:NAD(P)-binding domain-containing protein [Microlunatus parietis]NYE73273.1 3-hydroxyisobutyrate dehydrogenase-like beta-hydroxyacid dehydrogenase [Microlunatus parietis]